MYKDTDRELRIVTWKRFRTCIIVMIYLPGTLMPALASSKIIGGDSVWTIAAFVLGALLWVPFVIWLIVKELSFRLELGDIEQRRKFDAPCPSCESATIARKSYGKTFTYTCAGCGHEWTLEISEASQLPIADM